MGKGFQIYFFVLFSPVCPLWAKFGLLWEDLSGFRTDLAAGSQIKGDLFMDIRDVKPMKWLRESEHAWVLLASFWHPFGILLDGHFPTL